VTHRSPETALKPLAAIDPVTVSSATTTNGVAVDTRGWQYATFRVQIGTVGGTTTGVTAKLEQDDNAGFSSAADVTSATFTAADLLAGDMLEEGRVNCTKTERYLRIAVTTAGGSPSVPMSASVTLSGHDDDDRQDQTYAFAL